MNQVAGDLIFQYVSLYAGFKRFVDVLLFFMLGEKNCFRLRAGTGQPASRINAVERGHAYVEHHDIRVVRFRQANGILPVGGFRDNLKFLTLQQGFSSLTDQHVVICEYDSNWHDCPPREFGWKVLFRESGWI